MEIRLTSAYILIVMYHWRDMDDFYNLKQLLPIDTFYWLIDAETKSTSHMPV